MSPYSLGMFYGAWRAGVYYGHNGDPFVMAFDRYWRIHGLLMRAFQPFNRYKKTQKGEKFL